MEGEKDIKEQKSMLELGWILSAGSGCKNKLLGSHAGEQRNAESLSEKDDSL